MAEVDPKMDNIPRAVCGKARSPVGREHLRGSALRPMPGADRSRTLPLSGRGNRLELVKKVIALIGDRVALPALIDDMLTARTHSNAKDAKHCLRAIRTGLCVIDIQGQYVHVTAWGRALRDTGDPETLRERVLTGLFGFDHLLTWMDDAPRAKPWILQHLQAVNPGWKTTTFPRALLNWTVWMGLSVETAAGFTLTERGKAWRSLIHWTPEGLD